MKKMWIKAVVLGVAVLALAGYSARADQDEVIPLRARMSGFQEVTPKLTNGTGLFRATIKGDVMNFELTYSGLTGNPAVSHLHFGQRGVSGGVFLFLCGGGAQPACPVGTPGQDGFSGTISGQATAANVVGNADQGIPVGDFAAAVRVIRSGESYANVHTARFPSGEIRGQLRDEDQREH